MVVIAVLLPHVMLGVVLVLARYEEFMLGGQPPVHRARRDVPGRK
ncbi:hypothetical protein [Streptomyces sp. NBC_01431]|nr:hypothetical protein [Streptomyces sp. NBC_01431]